MCCVCAINVQTVGLLADAGILFRGYSGALRKTEAPTPVYLTRLWVDVEDESPSKYYDADPAVNVAFMSALVGRMTELGISVGVYTTKTYWTNIMDNALGYGQYPLWYPRYDAENSMDFFEPFADFSRCTVKQTGGNVGYCGLTQVDSDYAMHRVL